MLNPHVTKCYPVDQDGQSDDNLTPLLPALPSTVEPLTEPVEENEIPVHWVIGRPDSLHPLHHQLPNRTHADPVVSALIRMLQDASSALDTYVRNPSLHKLSTIHGIPCLTAVHCKRIESVTIALHTLLNDVIGDTDHHQVSYPSKFVSISNSPTASTSSSVSLLPRARRHRTSITQHDEDSTNMLDDDNNDNSKDQRLISKSIGSGSTLEHRRRSGIKVVRWNPHQWKLLQECLVKYGRDWRLIYHLHGPGGTESTTLASFTKDQIMAKWHNENMHLRKSGLPLLPEGAKQPMTR